MALDNLYDLLKHELQDLLSADHQLIKELPLLVKAACSENLKNTLKEHLIKTKTHARRLEDTLIQLNISSKEQCEGMEGIIYETNQLITSKEKSSVQDAAIIANLQKALCYEISCYGTAKTFAYSLELDEIADLLEGTLKEKAKEDKELSKLAEGSFFSKGINYDACKTPLALEENTSKKRQLKTKRK